MYKSVSFSSFGVNDTINVDTWRNKIDVPVFSQVGRRKGAITLKYKPIILAILILIGVVIIYHYMSPNNLNYAGKSAFSKFGFIPVKGLSQHRKLMSYNSTYPLTKPVTTPSGSYFRIGLITDMDTKSKYGDEDKDSTWGSILRYANLSFVNQTLSMSVIWKGGDEDGLKLSSSYAYKNRGMELSELIVFNARVYTIDDRTGIIYEIIDGRVAPWVILSDGDGHQAKGFKGEWLTVKNERLYIGGLGKEWTTADGKVLHSNPQWIKTVDKDGSVANIDWVANYKAMQQASGYVSPGYIIHESAVWSNIHQAWFFLPRRASHDHYDENLDELRATNLLFRCTEDFSHIKVSRIGPRKVVNPARGYSSFKFVPGTKDYVIIALKTEEVQSETKSYITSFTIDGKIIMADKLVSQTFKYEGIEFL